MDPSVVMAIVKVACIANNDTNVTIDTNVSIEKYRY